MGLVNLHFILLKVNRAWDQTPVTPVLGNGQAGAGELQTLSLGGKLSCLYWRAKISRKKQNPQTLTLAVLFY